MSALGAVLARGDRALEKLELVFLGVNVVAALAMMAVVVYGVVMRYIFNVPARWVAEVSEYLMVALTFLALGHVQRRRKHLTIDFLLVRRNENAKALLLTVTTLFALVIFVLLTGASWIFFVKAWESGFTSDAADIPLYPSRLLVPLGAFVMSLQLLADVIRHTSRLMGHREG